MRPISTDWVALSVCLSVGHVREPCKNSWTERHAVWVLTRVGPSNHVIIIIIIIIIIIFVYYYQLTCATWFTWADNIGLHTTKNIRQGRDLHRKGHCFGGGLSGPLKSIGSLLRFTQQKDHSILPRMTYDAAFRQNSLTTVSYMYCHSNQQQHCASDTGFQNIY